MQRATTKRFGETLLLMATLLFFAARASAQHPADGLRTVDAKRFGVTVKTPVAWNLIAWSQDEKAFVLRLPQENRASEGSVSCELTMAPESLDETRKRIDGEAATPVKEVTKDTAKDAKAARRLTLNRLQPIDAARFGDEKAKRFEQRLDTLWEIPVDEQEVRYELTVRMVGGGMLYAFTLRTDQAHFDAYRADFEDMLAGAKIVAPETNVRRLPGDLWMQRDYRFALRLPDTWRPAFGANDKVLFFAVGASHPSFTEHLTVRASASQTLDLAKLRETLPREIATHDPQAAVTTQFVKQGSEPALEAVIQTKRDEQAVTTIERRFRGPRCNYEVTITCLTTDFARLESQLRRALDSFCEVDEPAKDAT